MKRFFIFFTMLVLAVCALAVPAAAASYAPDADIVDYVDFVDSVTVENDMDIVSMKFPDNYCWSGVYDSELGKYQYQRIGNYVRFPALSNSFLSPVFMPLGWHNTRRLSLAGVPDGTTFRFRYFVDYETTEDVTAILGDRKINSRISYWDAAGNYLSEQITDSVGFDGPVGYVSVVLSDIPENAASCHFQVEFWSVVTPNNDEGYITLTLDDFTLSMNLSAMQVQSDMTIKQTALLKEISTNQQITNEMLDEIQNYKPEIETPEGGEVVGDLENVEDNLMEDVNDGFDEAEQLQLSVLETLLQYVTAFGAVSYIFDLFAWIPFLKILLSVSLALGIVSTLLNIGLSVSSGASKSKSSGKQGAKGK